MRCDSSRSLLAGGRQDSVASSRIFAICLAAACLACSADSDVGPSAILITLDTTRADVIGCYGEDEWGSVTPVLDDLAREGLRYLHAHTSVPITLPAHASMLTGLYPLRHSVRDNALWPLPESALTLAELASGAGIQTAAFVASIVLDRSYGLAQGFGHYEQPERRALSGSSHAVELPARAVIASAIDWLRERDRTRPMFLWVHLFDPHGPYQPPKRYSEGAYARKRGYYGEVAAMDEEIGRLIRELKRSGDLDNSTLLVIADHGEAFGEYGEISHGAYTFETTLRVPLILRYADGYRAGEVATEFVSVVDVFPTLSEALELPPTSGIDGTSLYRRNAPTDRGVYFESYQGFLSFHWSPLSGWIDSAGKYTHSSAPRFTVLDGDQAEGRDLSTEHPQELRSHLAEIRALEALSRLVPELTREPDAELVAGIRALGYTSVVGTRDELPEPSGKSVLADPLDRLEEYEQALTALELNNVGRYAEAEALFRAILDENPDNYFALDRLGFALIGQERFAEAIEPLEAMVESGPRWSHSLLNLGIARVETGALKEAIEVFELAIDTDAAARGELLAYIERLRKTDRDKLADELADALGAAADL